MFDLLCIVGPTASGKTNLAVRLAAAFGGEIISADSRQVYRGMDIGTGKDLDEYVWEGKKIPYHLIDVVEAGYKYNVFEYQAEYKKISWPDKDSLVKQSVAVVCISVVVAAIIAVLDVAMQYGVNFLTSL